MGNKLLLRFIGLITITLLFSGCIFEEEPQVKNADNVVAIESINVDNYFVKGKKIQTFPKVPKRIFVVGENETETLLALGAEKNIFLAAAQNNRRYAMREENRIKFEKLQRCSSAYVNMEYVTMLDPDLIVAQQCIITKNRLKNTDYWNNRGIRTLIPLNSNTPSKHIHPETVELEMQFIKDLGKALRLEENAKKIVDSTYVTIAEVKEKTKDSKKPKVMFVEFMSSFVCYDKTKIIGDMATKIGAEVSENPPVIGFENIIKENPDILFLICSHVDYGVCVKKIWNNKALQKLNCVKNKKVFTIPLRFTYAPQVRTEDGIKYLAERMYPNVKFSWQKEATN